MDLGAGAGGGVGVQRTGSVEVMTGECGDFLDAAGMQGGKGLLQLGVWRVGWSSCAVCPKSMSWGEKLGGALRWDVGGVGT